MTFLRWAGSKKQLLDTLSCCWYAANCGRGAPGRYIEAFSGSAALFFRLRPARALLVDVNVELQQCLMRVRDAPSRVSNALAKFSCSAIEYYKVRAECEETMELDDRAARFIYLNRNCFNGLYRTNLQGHFNVPFGGARSGQLPTREQLLDAGHTLRGAALLTGDFFDVLAPRLRRGDFVYMDPPYAKRNVGLDNQYGPDVFGAHDIQRLGELAERVASSGGYFVISYAACDEIQPVAAKWTTTEVTVRRTIAASSANRRSARELLITNL